MNFYLYSYLEKKTIKKFENKLDFYRLRKIIVKSLAIEKKMLRIQKDTYCQADVVAEVPDYSMSQRNGLSAVDFCITDDQN